MDSPPSNPVPIETPQNLDYILLGGYPYGTLPQPSFHHLIEERLHRGTFMKITIFSTSRAGLAFARLLKSRGFQVALSSLYSQNYLKAAELLKMSPLPPQEAISWSDILVLTAPDNFIESQADELHKLNQKIPKLILSGFHPLSPSLLGRIHPPASINSKLTLKELKKLIFVGQFRKYHPVLKPFLDQLENTVVRVNSRVNLKTYHLACVFLSNFPQIMFQMGETLLKSSGLECESSSSQFPFDQISQQLFSSVQKNISRNIPLSGPFARGDRLWLERQKKGLQSDKPDLAKLIQIMWNVYEGLSNRKPQNPQDLPLGVFK